MSLENEKLKLEIAELQKKVRWGPVQSWVAMIGIVVVGIGLVVERYDKFEQRNFDLSLQLHKLKIDEMTRILAETAALCGRTGSVIQERKTIRVFAGLMIDTLQEKIPSIELPVNDEDKRVIEEILEHLEEYERSFSTASKELGYWSEAIEVEAEWKLKRSSPSPDFSIYYGDDLKKKWSSVVEQNTNALSNSFSLTNGGFDPDDDFIELCTEFIAKLKIKISDQHRSFCDSNKRVGEVAC